jgi:pyruvate dehydrogenase E2 component (dihydrolipoamide acetyltransferase)
MPTAHSSALHRVRLRKGKGDPVVMIHGFGADHNSWRILVAAAGLSRPILAIDLPGHGRSLGGATSLADMASAVAASLAEEGVTAADLVGHSLGAAVAATVAATADFRVRSLFLVSPAGLGPEINGDFLTGFCGARGEEDLAHWMTLLVADPASLHPAFAQVTAENRARPGVAEAQAQIAREVFPDGRQAFSIRATLDRLAVPIQVVFGAADRIIPARHMAGLPDTIAQHLLAEVGHMPQVEARDAVARLLADHLQAAD